MSRRYFGTDGIRGRVGISPISADFVVRLGRAAGTVLRRGDAPPKVLIGKDTRISGYMLESALEAGLSSAGAHVILLGPMPTPAVAYLTRSQQADAGIVISASHNPFADNGIKFFDRHGEKLDDAVELAIEAELEREFVTVAPAELGRAQRLDDARGRYLEFLKTTADLDILRGLRGRKVVVDCAHGAAYQVAPALLRELGFVVSAIGDAPDGFNINAGFGATDLAACRAAVLQQGADFGLALDGDADRLQLIGPDGTIYDGDDMAYLLARHYQAQGQLKGPVVGTVMSNLGIEQAIKALGIDFQRAAVGDRYVHQLLKSNGGVLGAEASGHVLMLDRASTGDGLMTALALFEAIAAIGGDLHTMFAARQRFPQRTVNIRIAPGQRPLEHPAVLDARRAVEAQLSDQGRLILRASGTEPLIRVTIEAADAAMVNAALAQMAAAVHGALPAG